jgi:crotonobetainyl-CoA:carnitine CoA-transferase CaiB-like acyl-CoA transferase
VLVHDFTPSEADDLKLDYERLSETNHSLVMTSIFPFGSNGPHRDYKAYDLTLLSAGGWTWLNGWPGRMEMPPLKPYGFQAAYQGGVNAAVGTMGALFARRRSGRGQHVEVSIQECIASILEMTLANWSYMDTPTVRWGQRPIQPVDMFQCKDGGWIFTLCIGVPGAWSVDGARSGRRGRQPVRAGIELETAAVHGGMGEPVNTDDSNGPPRPMSTVPPASTLGDLLAVTERKVSS